MTTSNFTRIAWKNHYPKFRWPADVGFSLSYVWCGPRSRRSRDVRLSPMVTQGGHNVTAPFSGMTTLQPCTRSKARRQGIQSFDAEAGFLEVIISKTLSTESSAMVRNSSCVRF